MHNLQPDALNNIFQHNRQNCDTGKSRLKAMVFPKFYRIKLIQQSFKYKGPEQWNKLPLELREIKSLKSFINQSRQLFITS